MIHPVATHGIHCQDLDCVLPACVNLKLGKMKNDIANRTMRCGGRGRRSKLSREARTKATWFQKEDFQSFLQDDTVRTPGYTNHQGMSDIFLKENGLNVLDTQQHPGNQLQSHKPQPFHTSERVTNQCFQEFLNTRTPFSGTKNDARQREREAEQIFSENCQNHHSADEETSSKKSLPESISCKKIENTSNVNSKPQSDGEPSNKLFEILSHLFQAFAGPMSAEMEQRYVRVLEKAYTEIRSAQTFHHWCKNPE
ncbi:hypothetical protein ACROYT_G017967 [Oculina patagonica]